MNAAEGAIAADDGPFGPLLDTPCALEVVRPFLFVALKERGAWPCVHEFNDAESTTHADVLALFDRAIALAEAP